PSPAGRGDWHSAISQWAPAAKYPQLPKTNCAASTAAPDDCCAPLRRRPSPSLRRRIYRRRRADRPVAPTLRGICVAPAVAWLSAPVRKSDRPTHARRPCPAEPDSKTAIGRDWPSPEYSTRVCWQRRVLLLPAIAQNDALRVRAD